MGAFITKCLGRKWVRGLLGVLFILLMYLAAHLVHYPIPAGGLEPGAGLESTLCSALGIWDIDDYTAHVEEKFSIYLVELDGGDTCVVFARSPYFPRYQKVRTFAVTEYPFATGQGIGRLSFVIQLKKGEIQVLNPEYEKFF